MDHERRVLGVLLEQRGPDADFRQTSGTTDLSQEALVGIDTFQAQGQAIFPFRGEAEDAMGELGEPRKPLSEAERARLRELQAKISGMLDDGEV